MTWWQFCCEAAWTRGSTVCAERFDWLTDYRLKLLKLDDDARFYISLVDVILGICAEQRAESESDQTA